MEPGSSSSTRELGLRTKDGTSGLGSGAILGIYGGFMCSTQHFNHRWKCEPYTHWQPRLLSEFAYKMNVYAADMTRPADVPSTTGLLKDVWHNVLAVWPPTSCFWASPLCACHVGNINVLNKLIGHACIVQSVQVICWTNIPPLLAWKSLIGQGCYYSVGVAYCSGDIHGMLCGA